MTKKLIPFALMSVFALPAGAASWSNSDVVVGNDVVINGPIERGTNSSNVVVSNMTVGNGGVSMPGMHVGNGGVHIEDETYYEGPITTSGSTVNTSVVNGNSTSVVTTSQNGKVQRYVNGKPVKVKSKTKYKKSNGGVGKQSFRSGNCDIERKWVGSMLKEQRVCR